MIKTGIIVLIDLSQTNKMYLQREMSYISQYISVILSVILHLCIPGIILLTVFKISLSL